jgi:acyl-CoA thioester hydrolase
MTQLHDTHRSTVTPDQIDHLGHMNVRFYGVNALRGTEAFLERCGTSGASGLRVADVYTRHHREQLLGAELVVRTGVLDVDEDRLRLYHELVEERSDTLAASFVHTLLPASDLDGSVAADVLVHASDRVVALPDRGAPRSISLGTDPLASAPDLEELQARGVAMRSPRTVIADECDEDGTHRWSEAPGLVWGGEPLTGSVSPMLHQGPNGEAMGWASMETRLSVRRLPSVGDRIQSFGAVVDLRDKTSQRMQWAFDLDRGDLLVAFEVVNLAFDTGGRRAMSIPDHVRADEQALLHPDLAPRGSRAAAC